MSDSYKDYNEYSEMRRKRESNPSAQARTASRPGRYLSQRRMAEKKRKARRRNFVLIAALALVLLILCIVLICKGCAGENTAYSELAGVWNYDEYTDYEFDDNGNGCMCLDNKTHYEFTYTVKDGTLFLDFTLDYVTDCQYGYTVEGDTLTLIGGEGTAEQGKEYVLRKCIDHDKK